MPYFNVDSIRRAAEQTLSSRGWPTTSSYASSGFLAEALTARLAPVPDEPAGPPVALFDIFLSHSSLDSILVLGLYKTLSGRGYKVYVDTICDPQLDRSKVDRATTRTLRYRMAQCKSLFVATTENTPKSSWVPWELGFMDGWNNKAAILPILPAGAVSFKGQEFFELYPEARDDPAYSKPNDLDIYDRGIRVCNWETWLTRPRTF